MEITKTQRGFELGIFKDVYGVECSVQESSSVEPRLWIGVNDAQPQIMRSHARRMGLPNSEGDGWMPFEIPKEVLLSTRMHLDVEQVQTLVNVLNNWLKNKTLKLG